MRADETGALISEIWPEPEYFAANRGDSMANTSRRLHLYYLLGLTAKTPNTNELDQFVSPNGYLRHPSPQMPMDWQETDSTSDQCLPFFLAGNFEQQLKMVTRIKGAGWRTGNGDIISPAFYFVLTNKPFKLALCLAAQLAIFKIPFRWSDGKRSFELSAGSSADVLNWFHCIPLASPWVKKLISKDWIKSKIKEYYQGGEHPEPNSDWVVELYNQTIDEVFK